MADLDRFDRTGAYIFMANHYYFSLLRVNDIFHDYTYTEIQQLNIMHLHFKICVLTILWEPLWYSE